jgi:hypothetical protein
MAPAAPSSGPLAGPPEVTALLSKLNARYEAVHKDFEANFWSTKMGLKVRGELSSPLTGR